jgi:septum formation protein
MLLKDKLAGRRLILASASPRRRQILADAGLPFTLAEPYEAREVWPAGMPAERVAEYLAALKSDAYPVPLAPGDILLTADTTVVLGEKVLGKPADRAEAVQMLAELSGRAHKVITGVALRTSGSRETFGAESTVWFRPLTAEEIAYYVDAFRPMDKAGAYAIQEWIGYVGIERIEGSFYNVMGLPIQMIYNHLNEITNYEL